MVNLGGTDERWWCRGMEAYEGRPTCMGEGTGMQDTGGTWDEDADVGGMAHVNEGWGKAWLGCMERHGLDASRGTDKDNGRDGVERGCGT